MQDKCSHTWIVTDSNNGEELCSSCGQILSERLEDTSLQSVFDVEDYFNLTQTGPPRSITKHDYGLNTIIGRKNVDSSGKRISRNLSNDFSRLRLWDGRSQTKQDNRSLLKGLMILEGMQKKLTLPERVVERTAYLYRKSMSLGFAKGRGAQEVLAGCTFLGCKLERVPRSLHEICLIASTNKGRVYSVIRLLVETFDIVLDPPSAIDYFPKIANMSGMSKKSQKYSYELLKKIEDNRLSSGKNPLVLCGTVAWIASARCGDRISQQTIADVAGITTVSIRNCSKLFVEEFLTDKNT